VSAVDVTRQPAAWADFLSLAAGQRAKEHTDNFGAYRIRIDPQSDLLKRLNEEDVGTATYANLLAEFASNLGAAAYAQAARDLAVSRSARVEKAAEPILMPPFLSAAAAERPAGQPYVDPLLLGALIDLSLDRVDQAVDALLLRWEREPTRLTGLQARLLQDLAAHPALRAADAERLLAPILRARLALADLETLLPVTFRLALRTRQMPLALSAVDRALAIDETNYLALNPEVATQIQAGAIASALDHFARVADRDATGFTQMRALRAALHAETGANLPISSIRSYLVSLKASADSHDGIAVPIDALPHVAVAKLNGSDGSRYATGPLPMAAANGGRLNGKRALVVSRDRGFDARDA
jgi:hypothetical protein